MRYPRLVLHAKAFALPGALSRLQPSDNDARLLADMGLVRAANGKLYPAVNDQPATEPKRAA
ncbi:MAG TPA: hypothetical protein VM659_25470 [Dongiaceae bacterium]|nr:hypothetical protein [Dongiaceae bacterium]